MKYSFYKYNFTNRIEGIGIKFEDKKYELLEGFFVTEISAFSKWIEEEIDSVLSGKEQIISSSGNAYLYEISKEKTVIRDSFAEESGIEDIPCIVDTSELKILINEWKKLKLKTE